MKVKYDKKEDVMSVWFSDKPVDYAEQSKSMIMHFSKDNKPVLMEMLNATEFLKITSNKLPVEIRKQVLSIRESL